MTYIFNKKYRDRLELLSEILELGNGNEVRIGNISHKSGLPYNLLKKHLKILLYKIIYWNIMERKKPIKRRAKASTSLDSHNLVNIVVRC
jgi:predicted transcriptional regulator